MQLSDEDIRLLCVGGAADAIEGRATSPMIGALNEAYALGVERARNTPDAATRAVIGFVE